MKSRVYRVSGSNVAFLDIDAVIDRKYRNSKVNLSKYKWARRSPISKSEAKQRVIYPPYSIKDLLGLLDSNEYHFACIDAIEKNVISSFECNNSKVMDWWKKCQTPPKSNKINLLRQMIKYDQACGNGFLIKLRDALGNWVGLQRLLPNETLILENYNKQGFLEPNYIQYRNLKQTYFPGKDIIHMLEETHKSEAWGLNSLPIAINNEILKEIKALDYNNFKNGLFIDYLIIVEGLLDDGVEDEENEESAFDVIKKQFQDAITNKRQHSSIILETGDKNVKVHVEELRKSLTSEGQEKIEKKYKDGILAYHRVPQRLVSQETPGKLGGDNSSDLKIFYINKIQPLQEALANILTTEFQKEYGWDVEAKDFNFGNMMDNYIGEDERYFVGNIGK